MEVRSRVFPAFSCCAKENTEEARCSLNLRILSVVLGIIQIIVGLSIVFSGLPFHTLIGWSLFSSGGLFVLVGAGVKCLREIRKYPVFFEENFANPIVEVNPKKEDSEVKEHPIVPQNKVEIQVIARPQECLYLPPNSVWHGVILPLLDDRSQYQLSGATKYFKACLEGYWQSVCTTEGKWNSRFRTPWSPKMSDKTSSTWKKHYSTIRPIEDAASFPKVSLQAKTTKFWGTSPKIDWVSPESVNEHTISGNKLIIMYSDGSLHGVRFKTWDLETGHSLKEWKVEDVRSWHILNSQVVLLTPTWDIYSYNGEPTRRNGRLEILDLDKGTILPLMENADWDWKNARHIEMNQNKQVLIFGCHGASVCDYNELPAKEVKLEGHCSEDIWWAWGAECIISWERNVEQIRVWDPSTGQIASTYSFSKLSIEPELNWRIDQNHLFYRTESGCLKGFDLSTCSSLETTGNWEIFNSWQIAGDLVFSKQINMGNMIVFNWRTGKHCPSLPLPLSSSIKKVSFVGRKIFILIKMQKYKDRSYQVIQWSEKK